MPFRFAYLRLLPLKDGLQRSDRPRSLGEASRDGKNLQHPADRVNGWFMAALPGGKSGSPKRHVPEKARDPKPYELPYALSVNHR